CSSIEWRPRRHASAFARYRGPPATHDTARFQSLRKVCETVRRCRTYNEFRNHAKSFGRVGTEHRANVRRRATLGASPTASGERLPSRSSRALLHEPNTQRQPRFHTRFWLPPSAVEFQRTPVQGCHGSREPSDCALPERRSKTPFPALWSSELWL